MKHRLLLASILSVPVLALARHGWSEYDFAKLLKPGTTATLEGYPNRNKPEEMRAERITVAGKTVELR